MKIKYCGLVCAALAGPALALDQWLIWRYAPLEAVMGLAQKIFYLHVPLAWWSLISFLLAAGAGAGYLRTRKTFWDNLGLAAAEVGLLFATLTLATGLFWGKYAWGVWWTADPRLITFLVLWFTYAGGLAGRGTNGGRRAGTGRAGERARVFSAVFNIIACLNVPLVFLATRLLDSVHPNIAAARGGGLTPEMLLTLLLSIAAFGLVWGGLLTLRLSLGKLETRCGRLEYLTPPTKENSL